MKVENSENLTNRLLSAAAENEARPALWAMDELLTYGELLSRASRLANALSSAGVCKGNRVAIFHERSCGLYVAILACLLCGAIYVPLNPRFPKARNANILKLSGALAVVVDEPSLAVVRNIINNFDLEFLLLLQEAVDDQIGSDLIGRPTVRRKTNNFYPPDIGVDDLAYLLFTSGSTGVPKGVPISHGNLCAYLDGLNALNSISANDRFIQLVDVTFDLSAHDIFLAWTNGAAIYSVPDNAGAFAARFVNDYDLTCWLSVPSTPAMMKEAGLLTSGAMPSLRITYFCGEALTNTIVQDWAAAAPNSSVTNLYGPTEATIAFSAFRCDLTSKDCPPIVPIGHPIGRQNMAVMADDGTILGEGEVGELHLAGSQLSPGYWNAPQVTAERFVQHGETRWYRTGDLVRAFPKDGFHYVGRSDHQVKIQGYRVELLEIEVALCVECNTRIAAVVTLPEDETGIISGCAAYVVGMVDDLAELRSRLKNRLPSYMVPKRIAFLESLPLNSNGKVDYPALRTGTWRQRTKEF